MTNVKLYFNCKKSRQDRNKKFTCLIFSKIDANQRWFSTNFHIYVAWIHVVRQNREISRTHDTCGNSNKKLLFLSFAFSLPVVSSPRLSCFAKQVLLYSGRLLCNLLFSSKGEGRQKWSFVKWEKRDREARSHRRRRCDYHTDAGFIVRLFLSQFRRDDEKRGLRRRSFCEERIKPFIQRQRAIVRQRRLFL